jgi:hypothetical protein
MAHTFTLLIIVKSILVNMLFFFLLFAHTHTQQLETAAKRTSLCATMVSVSATTGSVTDRWTVMMDLMKPWRATAVSTTPLA